MRKQPSVDVLFENFFYFDFVFIITTGCCCFLTNTVKTLERLTNGPVVHFNGLSVKHPGDIGLCLGMQPIKHLYNDYESG